MASDDEGILRIDREVLRVVQDTGRARNLRVGGSPLAGARPRPQDPPVNLLATSLATVLDVTSTATPLETIVTTVVRAIVAVTPGVTAAYVSPNGTAFLLTGPEWTAALSTLGGELGAHLQRVHAPDGPYIDGGFLERADCPSGWLAVV